MPKIESHILSCGKWKWEGGFLRKVEGGKRVGSDGETPGTAWTPHDVERMAGLKLRRLSLGIFRRGEKVEPKPCLVPKSSGETPHPA
ncbi:MAG: hypothetical protein ACRD3O_19355, partial [Terriglobia bacterium]